MNVLALVLAAAAPILEPDPGKLDRVQPRDVRGDDQALWLVDDDPATSWKADAKKSAFTWSGPIVENAKGLTLFVRAGCQDSLESFAAWSRPHHVVIEPERLRRFRRSAMLLPVPFPEVEGEDEKKKDDVYELADVSGWQAIALPYLASFTVKVIDVYPGKQHAEACISDVRVYVDAPKPVDAGEEGLALERIKRTIAERLTRTAAAPKRVPEKFVDVAEVPEQPAAKTELQLRAPDTRATLVKKGRVAISAARAVWGVPISKLEAKGWKRVSVDFVLRDDASIEESLAGREAIGTGDALLCTDDFKLTEATNPMTGWREKAKGLAKLADKPLECQAACAPLYAPVSVSALEVRGACQRTCGNTDELGETKLDVSGSAVLVKGSLEAPQQLLVISSRERGEREVYRGQERQLLVYENGRVAATASITYDPKYAQATVVSWNDERSAVQGLARIELEGNTVQDLQVQQAKAEHAARDAALYNQLAWSLRSP